MLRTVQSTRRTLFKISDSVQLESGVTIPCITGQVGQVDVISQNGYRYKTDFWDRVLADPTVQQKIQNGDMLNMVEHPKDDDEYLCTPYEKASHRVMKAWVQNHQPFATLGLLNNPNGNIIKSLIEVGHKPGVSTRGLGVIDTDDISQFVSHENYCLLGWDIVVNPNFQDLKMTADPVSDSLRNNPIFKELCQMNQLKDSADTHFDKRVLLKEMGRTIGELQRQYKILASE